MALDFIDVFDVTTVKDQGYHRITSLSFGGNRDNPVCLRVLGHLSHNTEITFSRKSAEKLVKWLQENIIKD